MFKAQIKIKVWNAGSRINTWTDIGEFETQEECQRACERRNDGSLSWDDFRFLRLRGDTWSTDLR